MKRLLLLIAVCMAGCDSRVSQTPPPAGTLAKPTEQTDTLWGVFLPRTAELALKHDFSAGNAEQTLGVPETANIPILGRWQGAAVSLGLFDQRDCTFHLYAGLRQRELVRDVKFDCTGTAVQPLAGDWNGDGVSEVGIFDPATARFILQGDAADTAPRRQILFGAAATGLKAVVGDWNDDGVDSIGVWSSAQKRFYLKNKNDTGVADLTVDVTGIIDEDQLPFALKTGHHVRLGLYSAKQGKFSVLEKNQSNSAIEAVVFGPPSQVGMPVVSK